MHRKTIGDGLQVGQSASVSLQTSAIPTRISFSLNSDTNNISLNPKPLKAGYSPWKRRPWTNVVLPAELLWTIEYEIALNL